MEAEWPIWNCPKYDIAGKLSKQQVDRLQKSNCGSFVLEDRSPADVPNQWQTGWHRCLDLGRLATGDESESDRSSLP